MNDEKMWHKFSWASTQCLEMADRADRTQDTGQDESAESSDAGRRNKIALPRRDGVIVSEEYHTSNITNSE